MFDLEQAVAEWRRRMLAAGITAPEPLDELEHHLREEVEKQIQSGTGAQRAFEAAAERIGQPSALGAEFNKASGARRAVRKLMLLFCGVLAPLILSLSAFTFFQFGMSPVQQILALAAVVLILLAGFCWRYALRFLPVVPKRLLRTAIGLGVQGFGISLFSAFTNFIAPAIERFNEPLGFVAILWAFVPTVIVVCLGLGIMMSAREREAITSQKYV